MPPVLTAKWLCEAYMHGAKCVPDTSTRGGETITPFETENGTRLTLCVSQLVRHQVSLPFADFRFLVLVLQFERNIRLCNRANFEFRELTSLYSVSQITFVH